jgi:hypothetical protein
MMRTGGDFCLPEGKDSSQLNLMMSEALILHMSKTASDVLRLPTRALSVSVFLALSPFRSLLPSIFGGLLEKGGWIFAKKKIFWNRVMGKQCCSRCAF